MQRTKISLHLLDSAQGHPVQTWIFDASEHITIGRSEEQDICIVDRVVSRVHAELRYQEGAWRLVALGRNGVLIDDVSIKETELRNRLIFRLAPGGPLMRFDEGVGSAVGLSTISSEPPTLMPFKIDEEKKRREVGEIAEADYFKQLQRKAKELKQGSPLTPSPLPQGERGRREGDDSNKAI